MAGYYDLPAAVLAVSQNSMGTQVTSMLSQYWGLLMLGAQIMGFIVTAEALNGLYKKHRYNQPHYGEYKIPMIVVGTLLFNLNKFIDIVANTLGIQNGNIGF